MAASMFNFTTVPFTNIQQTKNYFVNFLMLRLRAALFINT